MSLFERSFESFHLRKLMKEYGGCQQCGWCCTNERLTVLKEDIDKLEFLLKPEYITRKDHVSASLKIPCPFLLKNRCSVYNKRPWVCKSYPFLYHYIDLMTIAYDCPLGKRICDDIIKYCEVKGVRIAGDEEKTESMKAVDKAVNDMKLNSGEGYESKIVNVPYKLFKGFLIWREKRKR